MTKQIDVNTATRNQLMEKAHELGLDAPNTMSKDDLRDLIAKQTGQKALGETPTEPTGPVEKHLAQQRKEPRVRIRIHPNPDHPRRIPVNANGVRYTIKPGVWVDVPMIVVGILSDAIGTKITQVEDERGRPVNQYSSSLQFPFEIHPSSAHLAQGIMGDVNAVA